MTKLKARCEGLLPVTDPKDAIAHTVKPMGEQNATALLEYINDRLFFFVSEQLIPRHQKSL